MIAYERAARRWIEPLLALGVGGSVTVRFLAPLAGTDGELGIVPSGASTYVDYPAAHSFVRELQTEEITVLGGQLRQGAREVLLSDAFADSVAAAQGHASVREMFEAAAGLLINGQICRIHEIRPLDLGDEVYAWQLVCDAPLDAA
jgi:hypothetical protein